MDLTSKTCTPCQGGIDPMPRAEAEAMLKDVQGWELTHDATRLERTFKFGNFVEANRFVDRVGELAEEEGHHPDITFGWGYATVVIWTHKIGGLHENDFIFAAKTNRLAE
ncbi:4a-hydroxytetrahydrobiopterin dehydratase [Natronocella acetinitrilica]|uniref:Putative pterin-4-alpha-carbinolamine dehydratase n=1 Tax=Natronocella acetinitrilica TaxID=414046 RepID=A0AAE3G778_9GAMM|nr:4a-hydroxytetrahydrobiopterin dehydratase [Natronocella acetinitrilica]MCP1676061.1 4a-hydroxytetrahydrobiopterin dehydratase [Natronocella acetinitrilica]